MTKQKLPQLLYVVLDNEQRLSGVFSSLSLAATAYRQVITGDLTEDDITVLEEEYGEHYHEHLSPPASIVVCQLDHTILWSYDSYLDIKHAIEDGEHYEKE